MKKLMLIVLRKGWVNIMRKNNYSPEAKKKTSRTKNGRKQFKTVVIGKI